MVTPGPRKWHDQQQSPQTTGPEAQEPLVLVVEADAFARETLAQLLRSQGYAVATAAEGRQALQQLRKRPGPALVLLDLQAPGVDGEFYRKRSREARLARVPMLALSARTLPGGRAASLNIAGQLRKPVNPDVLMRTVSRWCPLAKAR